MLTPTCVCTYIYIYTQIYLHILTDELAPTSPQDGIQYLYRADECKSLLVCPCVGVHRTLLLNLFLVSSMSSSSYLDGL